MSRAFFGFLAALSMLMLLLNVVNLDRAEPPVMLFWLLVGAVSDYKLMGKKTPAEG